MFWYDNQLVNVKWKTIISDSFKRRNGTRQGSVLSPYIYLFSIYIREVSSHAIDSGIGCFAGSLCCNIIIIVIFSPYKAMWHVDYAFPLFSINRENLENVNVFKYTWGI